MERYLVRAWVGLCLVGMLLGIRAPLAVTATAVVLAILALVPARVKPKELTMPPLPVGLPIETREASAPAHCTGRKGVWSGSRSAMTPPSIARAVTRRFWTAT